LLDPPVAPPTTIATGLHVAELQTSSGGAGSCLLPHALETRATNVSQGKCLLGNMA